MRAEVSNEVSGGISPLLLEVIIVWGFKKSTFLLKHKFNL